MGCKDWRVIFISTMAVGRGLSRAHPWIFLALSMWLGWIATVSKRWEGLLLVLDNTCPCIREQNTYAFWGCSCD